MVNGPTGPTPDPSDPHPRRTKPRSELPSSLPRDEWRLLWSFEADPPPELYGEDKAGRRYVREAPVPPTDPPGALDHEICITVFRGRDAKTAEPQFISLRNFALRMLDTRAETKEDLPWFKISRFGDKVTVAKSLRHDANVVAAYGEEIDYDGEVTPPEEAAEAFRQHRVAAVITTSPSHRPGKPRWRVALPFSKPRPPGERYALTSRAAGCLPASCEVGGESWTLSQSYYFGCPHDASADHKVILVEGDFIDLRDDLDEHARDKPAPRPNAKTNGNGHAGNGTDPNPGTDLEQALDAIAAGTGTHQGLLYACGLLARRWIPRSLIIDIMQGTLERRPPAGRDKRFHETLADLERLVDWVLFKEAGQKRQPPPPPPNWTDDVPGPGKAQPTDADDCDRLEDFLKTSHWLKREIPPPERLLGDLLTTTSRVFLVGRTGLGKTLLGMAMAAGMASGKGFLHWKCERPARIVYLDGEMPLALLQQRLRDEAARIGCKGEELDNLMLLSVADAEAIAKRWPDIGTFEALNTDPGQEFIKRVVHVLKPDAIIFDNVQALVVGVQKEEETWVPVLNLIQWLTKQRIGQLWLDHTGHAGDHQYGTSTKAWRFDTIGLLGVPADNQRNGQDTAMTLTFDHPGKARCRTPDNWHDFAPQVIRLSDGRWTTEEAAGDPRDPYGKGLGQVKPSRVPYYDALVAAIGQRPCGPDAPGSTTVEAWRQMCRHRHLIDGKHDDDFRRAKSELLTARWVVIEEDIVTDLKGKW